MSINIRDGSVKGVDYNSNSDGFGQMARLKPI